jgi:hypothetical protein
MTNDQLKEATLVRNKIHKIDIILDTTIPKAYEEQTNNNRCYSIDISVHNGWSINLSNLGLDVELLTFLRERLEKEKAMLEKKFEAM